MARTFLPEDLIGVVDMGSNGIRFSISNMTLETARIMPTIFQDRCGVSLYDAQYATGEKAPISDDVIQEVLAALLRFKHVCKGFGVLEDKIRVVATEATRTAINSAEFLHAIEQATGWKVVLLAKEEEGRIGALGIVSSFSSVNGLAMDLGGGSVQLTWVRSFCGEVQTHPNGSVSLPYGAAALKRLLEVAEREGDSHVARLQEQLRKDLEHAIEFLAIPKLIIDEANSKGGYNLYLSGGGFRGWGYLLMDTHEIQPYPIPIINGFEVSGQAFAPSAMIQESAQSTPFRVSSRRASQVPAVSFLITTLLSVLRTCSKIHFAQGGLREGLLFSNLPNDIRGMDPLVTATLPYRSTHALMLSRPLLGNLESLRSSDPAMLFPSFLASPSYIDAIINLSYFHSTHPKDIQASAALRSTTTGVLASVHGLSHQDRALVGLSLCERWGGELNSGDLPFYQGLQRLVGHEAAWWTKYAGTLARGIAETYPTGNISEELLEISSTWKYKHGEYSLEVTVNLKDYDGREPGWAVDLKKLGKSKNLVEDSGLRVRVKVQEWVKCEA